MSLLYFGNLKSETVLIQMVEDRDLSVIKKEADYIQEMSGTEDFMLVAVRVDSWNDDLSPWQAPPVFGKEPFGDGAESTLAYLTENLIPSLPGNEKGLQKSCLDDLYMQSIRDVKQRTYYIGGYSLAGLFALWAGYQTDLFAGVAAASPSVWFPGFADYIADNRLKSQSVYLSLGDKEEKTRNPAMVRVGSEIREIYRQLDNQGAPCVLEWNQGNHFKDTELRMAKGFAWLMGRKVEKAE